LLGVLCWSVLLGRIEAVDWEANLPSRLREGLGEGMSAS
jgi:hypothetical protein